MCSLEGFRKNERATQQGTADECRTLACRRRKAHMIHREEGCKGKGEEGKGVTYFTTSVVHSGDKGKGN